VSALAVKLLAAEGAPTLAVDCDPNPTLAEEFGLASNDLERFDHSALRRAGATLELTRQPAVVQVAPRLWLLGGPPSSSPLNDAVARGIAGVLVAGSYEHVITDLGAGPELTRIAVGGVLNPADLCVVLVDGSAGASRAAAAVEEACRAREVPSLLLDNTRGDPAATARHLAGLCTGAAS
jgi:CO dehydrogenase nickel-insertion accessory protein CooC1